MFSIPKNLFYVIHRCGNLHKLEIFVRATFDNQLLKTESLSVNLNESFECWVFLKTCFMWFNGVEIYINWQSGSWSLRHERLMGSRGLKPCMQCTRTRWEDDDCKKYKDTDKTRLQIHNETRGGVNWWEVNGIQRSEILHALLWNWMMIMRNTDRNKKYRQNTNTNTRT